MVEKGRTRKDVFNELRLSDPPPRPHKCSENVKDIEHHLTAFRGVRNENDIG